MKQSIAGMVLLESECDGKQLYDAAAELLGDEQWRSQMRKALLDMAVVDSAERIYNTICELAQK